MKWQSVPASPRRYILVIPSTGSGQTTWPQRNCCINFLLFTCPSKAKQLIKYFSNYVHAAVPASFLHRRHVHLFQAWENLKKNNTCWRLQQTRALPIPQKLTGLIFSEGPLHLLPARRKVRD